MYIYRIFPSHTIKPVDFPYWGTRVRNRSRVCVRLYLPALRYLAYFMWCIRYMYVGVIDMHELKVNIIVWCCFCYNLDTGIFLLFPYVRMNVCRYWNPILFCLIPLHSQDNSCKAVSIQVHLWRMVFIHYHVRWSLTSSPLSNYCTYVLCTIFRNCTDGLLLQELGLFASFFSRTINA